MRFAMLLVVLAACASSPDDLAANQGPCTSLDEAGCMVDSRCQQAYVVGGLMPRLPLACLLVHGPAIATGACEQLDHDACRSRNDCAPYFVQNLGPADQAIGEPVYQDCHTEMFAMPSGVR